MFKFVKSLSGESFQTTVMMATTAEETYTDGEALKVTSGAVTKSGATDKPTHLAAKAYVAPATGNLAIPCYPILPHHEYETTFSADASSVTEGSVVTVGTGGDTITATTTNGVATITKKLGTGASGTAVRCRFI